MGSSAELQGIKPTTLKTRVKRIGIDSPDWSPCLRPSYLRLGHAAQSRKRLYLREPLMTC